MPRALKIWNGRAVCWEVKGREVERIYVCATTKKEVIEMLKGAGYSWMSMNELNNYFTEGAWGNSMQGITPERGVWVQFDRWQPDSEILRIV